MRVYVDDLPIKKYTELEETVSKQQSEISQLKKSNRNWRRKVQRIRNAKGDEK